MPRLSVLDLSPVAAGSTESQALRDTIDLGPPRRPARLPPLLARRAPRRRDGRQLLPGADDRPGRGRHRTDPRRLGRRDAPQPQPAPGRRAVQGPRRAVPGPDRPRDRPGARHRPDDRLSRCAAAARRWPPTTSPSSSASCSPSPARARGPRAMPSVTSGRPPARRRCRRSSCSARATSRPGSPPPPGSASPSPAQINPEMAVDALRLYRDEFRPSDAARRALRDPLARDRLRRRRRAAPAHRRPLTGRVPAPPRRDGRRRCRRSRTRSPRRARVPRRIRA